MHLHFDRSNELKVTSLRVIEPPMDELLSPISKAKKHDFFVTSRNIESNISQIQKHHKNLNNYIEGLQDKVNKRVQSNQAEILVAYKNHLALVKKDMEEIKKETQAQANNSNSYEQQLEYMEKKLIIFRDESLRLFQKLVRKEKQIEEMRNKMDEMTAEKRYMDELVKSLTKKNKQLEMQLGKRENQPHPNETDFTHKFDISQLGANVLRNKSYRHKNRTTLTSANLSKAISNNTNVVISRNNFTVVDTGIEQTACNPNIEEFVKKIKAKLNYLDQPLLSQVSRIAGQTLSQVWGKSSSRAQQFERGKSRLQRATRISMRSKSNYTVDYNDPPKKSTSSGLGTHELQNQSKKFNVRQQMSGYFTKCVQTIKKEITRRRDINSLSFYTQGNPISFETFKKADCYRLMELAFSNEKVIQGLYNLLLDYSE